MAEAMGHELAVVAAVVLGVAVQLVALKWVRVGQREHYLPGRIGIFFALWYRASFVNQALLVIGFILLIGSFARNLGTVAHLVIAAAMVACVLAMPVGLGFRGRTSKLALTARLKRLLVVVGLIDAALTFVGWLLGFPLAFALLGGYLAPAVVELALVLTRPLEDRLMQRYVDDASERLRRVRPRVVGITGSFGKTTTKNYLATLLEGSVRAVASPASFNNRGGLARAINERLVPGTEVFIAEMGTFGPGEIAALCAWIPPQIAVITALGPVHLERFGSEASILRAKLEITEQASVVIINIDYPRLALAAKALAGSANPRRIIKVSAITLDADVTVKPNEEGELLVYLAGSKLGKIDAGEIAPTNLACAIAAALECGVTPQALQDRLGHVTSPANRLVTAVVPESGIEVLDDTYNSNPAGARRALAALERRGAEAATKFVVTPGMVELGKRQYPENYSLGKAAGLVADQLIIVGKTNRAALVGGAAEAQAETPQSRLDAIVTVRDRASAIAHVKRYSKAGDVVLYENDLPDHYP
ncbi:Mur ligase family protein [Ferrimicrobium sp.]|uniref:Mur ligase family protein n=1 Tax=Ferrimicrobium sp. TaxID=2926050 RepID=UPI0026221041|nr:Mur ligase family protein [Ferrimicrobium sp.]